MPTPRRGVFRSDTPNQRNTRSITINNLSKLFDEEIWKLEKLREKMSKNWGKMSKNGGGKA